MTSRIQFKRVWGKNFRSIDNMGMELLYGSGTTCVGSLDNGAGKSTMLIYALFYALFDKNYKKGDNKSALINSSSNKDCVVHAEFDANGSSWKVVRGQKPTLFEIYKDGVKIEDEAALNDYAKNLEKVIGMDEKVFCNTVALGKDKFVPFVAMSAPDRRNYGEQMLDLVVISRMSDLNKEAIKALNIDILTLQSKMNQVDADRRGLDAIIEVKKQHAAQASQGLDDEIAREKAAGAAIGSEMTEVQTRLAAVQDTLSKAQEYSAQDQKIKAMIDAGETKLSILTNKIASDRANLDKNLQRLDVLLMRAECDTDCPHCQQKMPEDRIKSAKQRLQDEVAQIKEQHELNAKADQQTVETLRAAVLKATASRCADPDGLAQNLSSAQAAVAHVNSELAVLRSRLSTTLTRIKELTAKKEASEKDNSWDVEVKKLDELATQQVENQTALNLLQTRMKSHEINAATLKDDGAKAEMVDQYLPYINSQINHYLDRMNLFINIELDTEFEIKMNAPDRRGQSISSLSTGQQCRIDLAVLLAWRDVARAAAGCDTNILILDEILENMSEQGVEDFIEMWGMEEQSDVALYVVTQRISEFSQHFDNTIMYKLTDARTELVTSV